MQVILSLNSTLNYMNSGKDVNQYQSCHISHCKISYTNVAILVDMEKAYGRVCNSPYLISYETLYLHASSHWGQALLSKI